MKQACCRTNWALRHVIDVIVGRYQRGELSRLSAATTMRQHLVPTSVALRLLGE